MIIERYLLRELTSPFLVTLATLMLTFTGYASARYLGEAATGDLPLGVALALVGLKGVVTLDAIVPVALFVSVALGLSRLHRDQEINALRAAGLGEDRVVRAVAMLVVPVAIGVAVLAIEVRPAVYRTVYLMEQEAERRFDLERIPAGRFYTPPGADFVLFADDGPPGERRQVYALGPDGPQRRVIFARELRQVRSADGARTLHFTSGEIYHLDPRATKDGVLAYGALDLRLAPARAARPDDRRKSKPLGVLVRSTDADEVAEAQWRLSAPFSVLAFGLLAVPVARTPPRQSRQGKVLLALLASTLYYNLLGALESAVEHGLVPLWPGTLALPVLALAGVVWLLRTGNRP